MEHEEKVQKPGLEFSFEVRHFLNMYELTDENYVIYTHFGEEGRFLLTLFCVKSGQESEGMHEQGERHCVFFGNFSASSLLPFPVQHQGR